MTKRREVYFEYESVTDKPSKGKLFISTHAWPRILVTRPILVAYDVTFS